MKQRPSGFLSTENIDQEGEIFDYIRELHDYLWRFIRVYDPSASGKLNDYIDDVLIEQENNRLPIDSKIEYAKIMCDEQRRICLDNAQVSLNYNWITEKANPDVIRASIIDAPYPEELR